MRFQGLVVMVTGAGSGLGAATAQALAAEGASLALSDIDGAALARVARDLPGAVLAGQVDVTDPASVAGHMQAIAARFGRLDGAVNAAGVAHDLAALEDTPLSEFDRVMAVNLRGAFLCLQAQMPVMKAQGAGSVVMIASAAGLAGAGRLAAYAASKHGVVGLMRSAAEEGARHGVRVNAICPSFTDTPMLDRIAAPIAARHGAQGAQERLSARIPMRRPARVAEVTQAILWALAPENGYMTGAAIPIDGGLTAI
jgi:NAD(P)-dependent dehydrogenase (short-subunit alcohol dehydrogenase family)